MKRVRTQQRLRLVVVTLFVLSLSAARSSALAPQQERLKDPKLMAEGARLFAPNCGSGYCHGANGSGGGAPALRGKGLDATYLFKTISEGVSGTPMRGFKSELSEEQIWKIVAFILSETKEAAESRPEQPSIPPSPATGGPAKAASSPAFVGDAQAGKSLFFDSTSQKSCRACHSFQGEGSSIAADLSKVASRLPRELFLSIVLPQEINAVALTLKNGDRIVGIKKAEEAESILIYDIAELPAVRRTVQKADIASTEISTAFSAHPDYAAIYTLKQILDLVAFLKSSGPQSKAAVTLKDLL